MIHGGKLYVYVYNSIFVIEIPSYFIHIGNNTIIKAVGMVYERKNHFKNGQIATV